MLVLSRDEKLANVLRVNAESVKTRSTRQTVAWSFAVFVQGAEANYRFAVLILFCFQSSAPVGGTPTVPAEDGGKSIYAGDKPKPKHSRKDRS
ncbi:MAG TPA: hypothetical protein VMP08_25045 [Anaerolineae bacterium]|nr:hypothetical protein [Anaerolineae bacterium]